MKTNLLKKMTDSLKMNLPKLPKDLQNEFDNSIFRMNYIRTRVLTIILFFASLLILSVDYINYKNGLWHDNYGYQLLFYTHILLAVVLLAQVLIIFGIKIGSAKAPHQWQKNFLTAIFLTQLSITAVISAIDQQIHGQITAYIMGAVWFGAFVYNRPLKSFLIYLFTFGIFSVGINFTQQNSDVLQGHYINGTLLVAISWIVSTFMYRYKINELVIKKELESHAEIDYLTGCLNRRALIKRLEQEISRARRVGTTTAILLLDIDFFKQVNDRFGHLFGDNVLKQIVNVLFESCRDYDFIGRFGGEEFIMCLPNTPLFEAYSVAERLRDLIGRKQILFEAELVTITISLGVASMEPGSDENIDAFISRADQAMYQAKKTRNQVCLSPIQSI